jgi:hypothetical protein
VSDVIKNKKLCATIVLNSVFADDARSRPALSEVEVMIVAHGFSIRYFRELVT